MSDRARLNGRDIDAVLIDAGGVLVDPNWRTVASVLGNHGVTADSALLAAAEPFLKRELDDAELIRDSTDVMIRQRWLSRLLHHAGIEVDAAAVDAATSELEALHLEHGMWEVVVDGVPEALDALRVGGLRLSLASNAEPLLRHKLRELGLAHRFDHLAISGEVGVEKPDPRFFRGALEALRVPAERAVHVGDLFEVDVVGARAAGLQAILVDVAGLSTERDVVRITTLADLPSLLGVG
ncbi:MAG: HAD family hydrolase [Candidatus Limnocylindria bacterium]